MTIIIVRIPEEHPHNWAIMKDLMTFLHSTIHLYKKHLWFQALGVPKWKRHPSCPICKGWVWWGNGAVSKQSWNTVRSSCSSGKYRALEQPRWGRAGGMWQQIAKIWKWKECDGPQSGPLGNNTSGVTPKHLEGKTAKLKPALVEP